MASDSPFNKLFFEGKVTKEKVTDSYDKLADDFDNGDMEMYLPVAVLFHLEIRLLLLIAKIGGVSKNYVAAAALEYCAGDPGQVLDVCSGTGLVGEQLKKRGFNYIDGVDASKESNEVARKKGFYRNLHCSYFTKYPTLDKPENSYDVIVGNGVFLPGHLPYDCIYEMIRLVRSGGIICIAARSICFDNKTVPEYRDRLVPLMQQLEDEGKWKKVKWETIPYDNDIEATLVVYQVL